MQYNEFLEKQIIGRLRVDNPWWIEKKYELHHLSRLICS